MTTILATGACLGIAFVGAGLWLVRAADNPPAANIGMLGTGAGLVLLVLVGLAQLVRML